MRLLCIDGNSILNRSYYGIKQLSTKSGIPTNAVFGFFNILLKLKADVKPDGVVVAFDVHAPTFRHLQFDAYKAGRHATPEELLEQFPIAKELIALMGYHVVEKEGYEADDILGAFSNACVQNGDECFIATGDRDSLQLVADQVTVLLATTKETIVYTPEKIREVYGVPPRQLIDVKALMGDSSDNIPGVKGIGEKTALGLIQKFGSLDGVYGHLDDPAVKPRVRTLLEGDRENAYLSRKLAEIVFDVPVDLTPSHYKANDPQNEELAGKLKELEMNKLLDKLGLAGEMPEEASAPAAKPVEKEVLTNPSFEDAQALLAKGDTLDFLPGFDKQGLAGLLFCLPDQVICYNYNAAGAFEELICKSALPKRTADAKSSWRWAMEQGLTLTNVVLDVELAGYLLDSGAKSYDLAALRAEYLPDVHAAGEQPEAALFPALCARLEQELAAKDLTGLLKDIELPFCRVLAGMELAGVAVDIAGVSAFGKNLEGHIQSLTQEIYELAGEEFNINSPQQLGGILFDKLGLPTRKKTKSGYSTNVEVLESLMDKHPIVPLILEYRKLTKLNSTYVVGLQKAVEPDGRIHSVFKQTEARTGRISSTEPNMQNIPVRTQLGREMRKFFTAAPGCVLVDADYSQIELRILAHIADDQNMIQAFLQGADIHRATASQVFHLPLDQVPEELRSRSKAINFGIVYGISAFSLSKDIGVTVSEAQAYIDEYLQTYSGVRGYMADSVAFGHEHGYVRTLYGRRRDLPELSSKNHNLKMFGERAAMNTPIQGTAADIIKIAMIKVADRLECEKVGAKIILQVHDEIILEAKQEEADKAARILKEEMEHAAQLKVPLKVDVNTGDTWYAAKG